MKASLLEKLNAYKCYADECMRIHIIYDESDLARVENPESDDSVEDDNSFKPEFVHQIFGPEETIFGYKNLRINYCLAPATLDAYIGVSYKDKVSPQRFDGIEADDIYAAFTELGCSPGFTCNLDVFTTQKLAQDRQFKPYGIKVDEYSQDTSTYEIFKVDSSMSEYTDEQFITYMERIQTMLLFYIETASFIDTEDTEWVYFILYKKSQTPRGWRYATIGFLSVYKFYAYPDKKRSRISQILIWPNHQSKGHAGKLVESVYKDALQHSDSISDITAETPSAEFVQVRDYVTAKLCHTNLASFRDKEQLKKGFTEQMAQEALVKLKIPRLQSKRCYEILRLAVTNENIDDEWRAYRLEIKKRLYLPFIRRTKYARNAGSVNDEDYNPEPVESSKSARDLKVKSTLENRFVQSGVTTIGFGSSSKPCGSGTSSNQPVTTIGFSRITPVAASSSNGQAQKKTVSFKSTSLNTSNSTTDNSHDDEEDDESGEEESGDDSNQMSGGDDNVDPNEAALNPANMFVSDEERKKYLDEKFKETTSLYEKIIKRMERENILSF